MNTLILTGLMVTMVTLFATAHGQVGSSAYAGDVNPDTFERMFPPWMQAFVPKFVIPKNWFEGPNVCVTADEVPMTGPDPFAGVGGNGRESSQTCKGDFYKYVCDIKTRDNGVTRQIVKTFQCCQGYSRPADGTPGCVAGVNQ